MFPFANKVPKCGTLQSAELITYATAASGLIWHRIFQTLRQLQFLFYST